MNFNRERTTEYYLRDTHVENIFINEMMVDAPGEHVKVYLFALMYAELGVFMSNGEIARYLGMDIEDVLKAWTYWEGRGVVRKRHGDASDRLRYDVEFLDLKSLAYGMRKGLKAGKGGRGAGLPDRLKGLLADEAVQALFREVEGIAGSPLTPEDMRDIASWTAELGADPHVISFAFRHAAGKPAYGRGARRTGYVGRIVRSWTEKGLRTVDEVVAHLEECDQRHGMYKRVMKALGMSRGATEEERRLIDGWFDGLGMGIGTVLDACKKTAGISNPNIKYVDTVLSSWAKESEGGAIGGKGSGKRQLSRVFRRYDELRDRHEREAEERLAEVYGRAPGVRAIDEAIRQRGRDISKAMLSGAAGGVARLREELALLQAERAALMGENGFAPGYTDLSHTCGECRDTGVRDDGARCACFELRLAELQAEDAAARPAPGAAKLAGPV
ncbi:MAG: DnaD domain protein [Clostridiales Family XIII bacterium]|jgi:DnaD/phage-associated family protein|nr:DnaD domain protein [Clostridiales Family XIII bacterium]